jgi:hypothetical protein
MMQEVAVHELVDESESTTSPPSENTNSNDTSIDDTAPEEFIEKPRSLVDILTANNLPARVLFITILAFLICFEILVEIGGCVIGQYYSALFSVTFLIAPAFWGWFFFLSRPHLRNSSSYRRALQSLMLGYFTDTVVYLAQWVVVYVIMIGVRYVYHALDKNQVVLILLLVFETLVESVLLEAIPEEILKYLILLFVSKQEPLPSKYSAIVYVIYSTLGFIFFSGTLRILRVYWTWGFYFAWGYFCVEVFLTSTMHIICGLWIGTNFIKQNFRTPDKDPIPTWRVVVPSIALHGIYMSFISVLYLLNELELLNRKLVALVVIMALLCLLGALVITILSVRRLMFDQTFYALLAPEGESDLPQEAETEMKEAV